MAGLHSAAMMMNPPPKLPWLLPLLIILFSLSSNTTPLCHASSSISSNQKLSGNQTLTSYGGNFVLGFFSPGNSTNSYIGIWYKKVPQQTVVWVANRETPILDRSTSELKLSGDGNLVLLDQSVVWSTTVTTITSNVTTTVAELLDTGNLVLRDGSNSSIVLWQSFDDPTDTYLPGMKIGFNKVTYRNKILTSWKSLEDPSPGIYSFELDTSGSSQFFIRLPRSRIYWSTGPWNGQIFRDVPEMRSNYIYNFSYVSNDKENYFIYSVYNNNTITKFDISVLGQIRQQTWLDNTQQWNLFWSQPRPQCQVYSLCGAYGICNEKSLPYCTCLKGFNEAPPKNWDLYDRTGGCTRNTQLQCAGDGFYSMSYVRLPDSPQTFAAASDAECKNSCLNNCSCTAYSYGSSNCSVWYGDLLNLQQAFDEASNVGTLQLRLAASELPTPRSKKAVISGTVVAGVVGILALSAVIWLLRRIKTKGSRKTRNRRVITLENTVASEEDITELPLIDFNTVLSATNNFDYANKLGEGGFGPVYKGKLAHGEEIAVKRLSKRSGQGFHEFKNEIELIAKLQHTNLVRLLGWCTCREEKILIYEYLPNKSLDKFIFDPRLSAELKWSQRFCIIEGIAQGLLYLHRYSRPRIIHRDLKTSNILLDAAMNPKISDFGLARIFEGNQKEANTDRVVGTFGYISPEYALDGVFSEKSDVFSFGVIVLEIVTGKRSTGFYPYKMSVILLAYVWQLWEEGRGLEVIDQAIGSSVSPTEVAKCVQLGLLCVQENAADRPTMSSVVSMLGNENASLPAPSHPAFAVGRHPNIVPANSPSHALMGSLNGLTITVQQGR